MSRGRQDKDFAHELQSEVDERLPARGARGPSPRSDAKDTRSKPSEYAKRSMTKEEQDIEDFGESSSSSYSNNEAAAPSEPKKSLSSSFGNLFKSTGKEPTASAATDYTHLKDWLLRPRSEDDNLVLCYIERERNMLGVCNNTFRLYQEPVVSSTGEQSSPRLLLTARKQNAKTCYYLITLDDSSDRGSDSVVGKLRGLDIISSQYLMTDSGISYDKTTTPSMYRKEYGAIFLKYESDCPSSYTIYIPKVQNSRAVDWQPGRREETMEARIAENRFENLTKLVNKQPKWDEKLHAHVLNFHGRVKEASIKNFQLCTEVDGRSNDEVVLQFGRISRDKFGMDVKGPLSIFQAFAICLSILDKGKIADRKGYELLNKIPGLRSGNTNNSNNNSNSNSNNNSNSNSNSNSGKGGSDVESTSLSGNSIEVNGSMRGPSTLSEMVPSGQYVKNFFARKTS